MKAQYLISLAVAVAVGSTFAAAPSVNGGTSGIKAQIAAERKGIGAHVCSHVGRVALLVKIAQAPADEAATISNVAMEGLGMDWKVLH